jgi:hypothetical protein
MMLWIKPATVELDLDLFLIRFVRAALVPARTQVTTPAHVR